MVWESVGVEREEIGGEKEWRFLGCEGRGLEGLKWSRRVSKRLEECRIVSKRLGRPEGAIQPGTTLIILITFQESPNLSTSLRDAPRHSETLQIPLITSRHSCSPPLQSLHSLNTLRHHTPLRDHRRQSLRVLVSRSSGVGEGGRTGSVRGVGRQSGFGE